MAAASETTRLLPGLPARGRNKTSSMVAVPSVSAAIAGELTPTGATEGLPTALPIDLVSQSVCATTFKSAGEGQEASFIFNQAVDAEIKTEYQSWWSFIISPSGVVVQFFLVFAYMHFDAGLPILQDLWKRNYGGPDRKLLYTKQTLLITQNICELLCIYAACYLLRGGVKDCFHPMKTLSFAPAGVCFGLQAVFGFCSMSYMSADCYSLYSQGSLVVLTLSWSIFFRTRISGVCWLSILLVVVGIVGFNVSDTTTQRYGIFFIGLKILFQSFACLYAEAFIKKDSEYLYIQMAWIKPMELFSTVCITFVMPYIIAPRPGELTAIEEIRQFGFYHHWNWLTVVIMVFNMGDTFMTATVSKQFDSVVKGVASVFDILYPTQVFVYFIDKPEYTPLKIISGAVIFLGSLNFVLGKSAMRKSAEMRAMLQDLQDGGAARLKAP